MRWAIGIIGVVIVMLFLLRDTPLVRAMGAFGLAIINLIGALLGLLVRLITSV